MDIAELARQNVWWKGKEHAIEDKHIGEFLEKKYKWTPGVLNLELVPGNIYALRGPRQVGKTTLSKLMIRNLLEKGVPEKAVFYSSCDFLSGYGELLDLVRKYLDFADSNGIRETYVFLDEVSGIKNWQKAVKFLADSGELKNTAVFLTGSHTLDIKHGFERLPGRTGEKGRDITLLPLSFREFVELAKPEISSKIKRIRSLSTAEVNRAVRGAVAFDRELKALFGHYLTTGGFPLAINEFYAGGKNVVPDYVYDIYSRWVVGDIVKWGKQEKILSQVLRTAILKQGTPVSWEAFAKEAEIKSHLTVSSYVEDLENMFVFSLLYFLDRNKKTADYNKNKKIYFFDPLIYHIFNKTFYFKDPEITLALIESVVAVHFSRFLGQQPQNRAVFYWKGKKEVDVVAVEKEKLFAVEVKYQNKVSKSDFGPLHHFKEGIVASKATLETGEKYSAVPVHLLLAVMP
ncbi:ATP-binding protein [Candidatus Micrarchaeota archaeon]|nr:ATP-binding protein [Candidatus Micrarchaeota archaeon]